MKDPEASWKGICSTSMKGPEPRPRKGWEEPQKSVARGQEAVRAKKKLGKGRPRRVSEERLGRRAEAHARGPEKAPEKAKGPEKAGKRSRSLKRPRRDPEPKTGPRS